MMNIFEEKSMKEELTRGALTREELVNDRLLEEKCLQEHYPTTNTVGTIGRFRPLHNGSARMLERLCSMYDLVIIGIGSANKYNARNPFTPEETKDMIYAFLSPRFTNYNIIYIPDFGHIPEYSDGHMWHDYIIKNFGNLDAFFTGNEYVRELLSANYTVIHPSTLLHVNEAIYLKGSMVRMAMAAGRDYSSMLPDCVSKYLDDNKLIERFRREFGLETLAEISLNSWNRDECLIEEKAHAVER
jgi:nicotinamide-nucleotide adenylyltransferase